MASRTTMEPDEGGRTRDAGGWTAGPPRRDAPSGTPAVVRRLRRPLTGLFLASLAALSALVSMAEPGFLDAAGGWLAGLVLVLAVLALAAWVPPPPPAARPRRTRM